VTITDNNGCTTTASATITQPVATLAATTSHVNVLCFGNSTGSIDLTVTGGTSPYTYVWSNTATIQDIAGLSAGTYTVTITDNNGCTTTASATITQPAAALAASRTFVNVLCFGNSTGSVDLTVIGGTSPYTYVWSNGATTQDISGLSGGTYNVIITDNNGCTTTATATITQPAAALAASRTFVNVLCFGNSTGSVDLTVTGGTSPYTYVWSNGATTQDISGLAAGTYNVTITDNNGCTTTASATITQPAAALAATTSQVNVLCFGNSTGSIDLTVTGGTSPYTYVWSNAATTQDITGLSAGTYNATITDNNGCTTTASATITQPVATLAATTSHVNVLCFGNPTGSIDLKVTGGTSPYTYVWSNTATIQDITGLSAGTYTVTITDNNGCTTTASAIITQPTAVTINTINTNTPICFGSTLNLASSASGGTGAKSFSWTGPNSFISNLQNPSITGVTTAASGVYSLTVIDANNCSATSTINVTVNPLPVLTCPSTDVSVCVNDATFVLNMVTPSGGTYVGTGVSGGNFNPATAGVGAHTLTYTYIDINGCINTCNFRIIVNQAPTVTVSLASQSVCSGLPINDIVISNPNNIAGTTFSWTRTTPFGITGIATSGTGSPISGTFLNSTSAAILVTFTITASNGTCSSSTTATVTVNPTATVSATNNNQPICSGNAIAGIAISDLNTVPGTTYSWTRDNTTYLTGIPTIGSSNPITGSLTNNTSTQQTAIFTITATTPNGCTSTTTATIIVNPRPNVPNVTPQTTQVCTGDQFTFRPTDGGSNIVPIGTTYTWTVTAPAAITGESNQTIGQTSISQMLTNTNTTTSQNATYTVTPTSGTCVGSPFTLIVTVNPLPPVTNVTFNQTDANENLNTICNGAQVGGGGQNDLDVLIGNSQPSANYFDSNGYAWAWEYSLGTSAGPDGTWLPAPGTDTVYYQHIMPTPPSVFSPIGDYYFRFSLTKNGCTTYSDIIHLAIVSTIILNAGGPDMICQSGSPVPITLSGASVGGTSIPGPPKASWSIVSGGGILSSTAFTTTPETITYTPSTGFTGTAVLKLTSNDPDNTGTCLAVVETREIIVLPPGNIQGCIAPANWTLTNTSANGSLDTSQAPCSMTLIGGNNGSGNPGTSDLKICSGAGTFSFNWGFTAPTNIGLTPVWHAADQTTNIGAGASAGTIVANRPSNLVAGDLIIVVLHARDNIGNVAAPTGFTVIRRETSGNNGSNDRGTVITYWKIATTTEPATYTFQASSMASGDTWVAIAGRITGHDPTSPIDANSGTNSGSNGATSITIPALTTNGINRLLIAALSIVDNDHGTPAKPGTMTTLYSANSGTGDDITFGGYSQNVGNGTTGTRQFSWTNSDPVAAQMFAIKPATLVDDAAYVIVNGVETLITNTNGTNGVFSIAVNANDQIGFRVKTTTNTGGVGKLTIYNPVIPNNAPVVTGITAKTIPVCNPATPTNYFVPPTATDNCTTPPPLVAGYPQTSAVVTTGCSNTQTRTWKYVDSCGLQSLPFVQTITWIIDTTAPIFTGTYSNVALGCNPTAAAITTALGIATATEGCSTAAIASADGAVIISGCSRSQTRTFTATDGCGNIATPVTRTVTWTEDVTFPSITATGTTTNLGCNPSAADIDAALGTATGTDGCAPPTVTFSDATVIVSGCDRSQTRTFKATDACNNIATTTRTVTWKVDTTPPTASNPATINIVGCNAAVPVPNSNVVIDEADNCGTPVVAFVSDATALVGCLETTTRTYSVTDGCNNTINVTQIITRTFDIIAPVITCPASQIFCQVAGNNYTIPTLVANDNCSGALTITFNITGATTRSGSGNDASGLFNVGVSTITWTVVDACGNVANCSVTVTINGLPVITTQPMTTLDCEGASVNFTAVATGTGLTYTWQRKKPLDASFITIPVEGNVSYPSVGKIKIDNVGSAQSPSGTQYQVVITSSSGCSVTSSAATLLVNEITGVSGGTTVTQCYGTNYSYTVATSTPPPGSVVSYQWKSSVASGSWNNVVDGVHFSGATTATLNIINGTPAESAEYRVYITFTSSGANCNVDSSSRSRTITFLPQLAVQIGTITQPDCIIPTGTVVLTGLPIGGTINPEAISYTGTTCTISGLPPGIYTYTVTLGTCTSLASANVVINAATTATWNGTAWINGPPNFTQVLKFTGDYNLFGDLTACSCIVNAGVTVNINSGDTMTLTNEISVAATGSILFKDKSSLVQIANAQNNSGNIKYERNIYSSELLDTDYIYWSSPVAGFTLGGVYLNNTSGLFYSYGVVGGVEDWQPESSGTLMSPGKGYIINGSIYKIPLPPPPSPTFIGVPNNGPYTISGIIADKSYLLGNPYPSALDANTFLDANQNVLDGTLYFWTHNTPIAIGTPNPGTGLWAYSGDDYASYNRTGGVGTAQAPSSVLPFTGSNDNIPTGKIASGQGFFGSSKVALLSTTIVYNNNMRVGVGGITGNNSQFFKTKNPKTDKVNAFENHRIWLDLTNPQGAFKQTLIGYVTDATNNYDSRFDGESFDGNDFLDFYSILQDKNLVIQGRALPFDENDEIPLGYRVAIGGTFSVAIDQTDGILSSKPVFIEDKLTNTVFNLKSGKYTFTTAAGTFDDRFVLRYTDKTLSTEEPELSDGITVLYSNNYKTLIIRNNIKDATVNSVTLFNMTGQKIAYWDVKGREQTSIQIPIKNLPAEIYIVKVKTTNGESSKKIIIK
jgi:hypothetical protein